MNNTNLHPTKAIIAAIFLTAIANIALYYSGFGGFWLEIIGWLTLIPYVLSFRLLTTGFKSIGVSGTIALWFAGTTLFALLSGYILINEPVSSLQFGSILLLTLSLFGIGLSGETK